MKLLIVDDCVDIVNIIASFLELSGHEIDKAYNGLEAAELLKNTKYNVVITDAEMPGMDGRELCEFIKAAFPAICIIGISGSLRALNELKNAGADICFSKPFRMNDLDEAIEDRFSSLPSNFDEQVGINDSYRQSNYLLTTNYI